MYASEKSTSHSFLMSLSKIALEGLRTHLILWTTLISILYTADQEMESLTGAFVATWSQRCPISVWPH